MKLSHPNSGCVAFAAFALSVLALALPSPSAASFPLPSDGWCGSPSDDWICHWRGVVRVADQTGPSLGFEETLAGRRGRQVGSEGTRVTTGPNAVARLRFRNRAKCRLGGNGQPGQFFTRPDEEILFRQVMGLSSCTNLRGHHAEASILCSPEERCPATLKATGTFFVKTFAPEAGASSTDTLVRRARIVVCSGFVRVRAESESSFAEAAGGATGDNRFVIVAEEVSSTTVHELPGETRTETSHSVDVRVAGRPAGPGECAASSTEEQEHTFIP